MLTESTLVGSLDLPSLFRISFDNYIAYIISECPENFLQYDSCLRAVILPQYNVATPWMIKLIEMYDNHLLYLERLLVT